MSTWSWTLVILAARWRVSICTFVAARTRTGRWPSPAGPVRSRSMGCWCWPLTSTRWSATPAGGRGTATLCWSKANTSSPSIGAPMRPGALNELLAGLSRRAGLERPVHPHMLRHSFGTSLMAAGGTLDETQVLLGHASITSTQAYLHPSQQRLRAAVERVGVLPPPGSSGGQGLPSEPERLERLGSLLDPSFLQAIGWDAAAQALSPPAEHPQLGRRICLVAGCGVRSNYRNGLCDVCQRRYRSSGLDLEVFTALRHVRVQAQTRSSSLLLCAVSSCPRPVKSAPARLCAAHATQRDKLGLGLATFLAHPRVRALPSFGECRVVACAGAAGNRRGLCRVHDGRWRWHRRHVPDLNFDHWCQTQPRPWIDAARVVLAGLAPLVQTELLYGLQERCRQDCKTKPELLRTLGELLRHAQ